MFTGEKKSNDRVVASLDSSLNKWWSLLKEIPNLLSSQRDERKQLGSAFVIIA